MAGGLVKIRLSLAQDWPIKCEAIIPPQETQQQQQQGRQWLTRLSHLDEVIFTVSCLTTIAILYLPMEYIAEKPVPSVIFHGHPSMFHAFLICLMGSCFGSVCSIHLRERSPKVGKFYHFFGVLSMVFSLAVFLFAAACW
ncbi:conserved hypothetical protein [Ricinus communis]|uniref:Uncharacterized protein n=1 Tax=Ricinus communis TaxID=3988 RepID=B9T5H4_RICCO|nr:conserved hypothetical protein [Ricinus communis]